MKQSQDSMIQAMNGTHFLYSGVEYIIYTIYITKHTLAS